MSGIEGPGAGGWGGGAGADVRDAERVAGGRPVRRVPGRAQRRHLDPVRVG